MRWIQFERAVQPIKTKLQWEEWVTDVEHPCVRCKALDGKRYVKGRGPQPIKDTHPGCRCQRVPVMGRFGPAPMQRAQRYVASTAADRVVQRSLRNAGYIVRSCKDCTD